MTKVLEPPKEVPTTLIAGINMKSLTEKYAVEALNNDTTTFHEVLKVFVHVCLYDARDARRYTNKIHTDGRAVCYWGSKEECEFVIAAFKSILVNCNLLEN